MTISPDQSCASQCLKVVTPLAIQLTTLSLRLQTYERIPDSTQDDQNNVNLDRTNRFVFFQLLTGWHAGGRYFYHIDTDLSIPDVSSIEL